MHLGSLPGERWLAARIAQVNALKTDLVVLLGDIFEGHGFPANKLTPIFKQLVAPMGVWAVFGNHEFHRGNNMGQFKDADVTLLRNCWAEVSPGFILAGVHDLTVSRRNGDRMGFQAEGRDFLYHKDSDAVKFLYDFRLIDYGYDFHGTVTLGAQQGIDLVVFRSTVPKSV